MTQRIGDYAASVPLLIPAGLAASIGGRNIDTKGYRGAQANLLVGEPAGGGGANTLVIKYQHSPAPIVSDQINAFDLTDDGSEKLRDGAASNIEFDIPFVPSVSQTVHTLRLMVSRLGTPALAAGGVPNVRISIQGDAAGDPDGTDIGGLSRMVATSAIGTGLAELSFFFDVAVDLVAATPYHVVVSGAYDVSATDCIQLHYNTVVGTSTCKHFDAAWSAADVNIDYWFEMDYLVYADIADIAAVTFTEATILNEIVEGADRQEFFLDRYNPFIRPYYTISGGTWTPYHALTVGDPLVQPVV